MIKPDIFCQVCDVAKSMDCETCLFSLSPPGNKVSFLHVSHHVLMPLYMWPSARFVPGGHVSLGGVLNSLVHVFMYGYYLLAALGGNHYRKVRGEKKNS